MQVDPSIFDSFDTIPWLKTGGKESSLSTEKFLRQVPSWADADAAYDEQWEAIKDQQQNAIAMTLSTQYPERFNHWNELFSVVRQEVFLRVVPTLTETVETIGLNPFYVNAISRDIQLYVMELTYAQDRCQVPIFFRNLFDIYSVGHFPCGWGGDDFPNGFVLYY